ncbi:MAG TPA: chemotaxis protein CheB [Myxococcaceae bacterium]|nr:chemotaxis protein CheB [Myxococcaceae bacterium]
MSDRLAGARNSGEDPVLSLLRMHGPALVERALGGGLDRVRCRSLPPRLGFEARRFLRGLSRAFDPLTRSTASGSAAIDVRAGFFACADPDDVAPLFRVWRYALRPLRRLGGTDENARLDVALAEFEERTTAAARAWSDERIDVVVAGASAGGIDALTTFLRYLGPALPATVLVVLHIRPTGPGLAAEVLARRTRQPISWATEGVPLRLGCAYVAPPGRHLVTSGHRLHIVDGPLVRFVKPSVDVLFQSAAEAFGRHTASVILSGTGIDGAAGTRAIHEGGGLTFTQDPESAQFRGMPDAAMADGWAHHSLPVQDIAAAIQSVILRGRSSISRGG